MNLFIYRRKMTSFRKARKAKKYSIEHIKRELERYGLFYSMSTIYKWDVGKRFPDLETVTILSKIFQEPVETLLKNPEETSKLIEKKELSIQDKLCSEIRQSTEFYQRCLNVYIDYLKDRGGEKNK